MISRIFSSLFFVAGVALLGLAAYDGLRNDEFTIPQTTLDLKEVPVGESRTVFFPMHNNTGLPVRIIGIGEC